MSVKQKQLIEYALQDIGTGLYLEGPEYLYDHLAEETDESAKSAQSV